MASWFWKQGGGGGGGGKGPVKVVLDGSDREELVENKEVFSNYVDHKFQELDRDRDGKLSVKELEPAVADIGAALGFPAQGSSPDSDQIYSEDTITLTYKSEFKDVLSDILLGMAAGLKRDPVVILGIDGEGLKEFAESPRFEPEAISMFSQVDSSDASLGKCMTMALEQLSAEQGMPLVSDSWVMSNIIEPVLQSFSKDELEQPASQEVFLEEFKKFLCEIAQRLQANPVIIAHSENTFNGSGIRRLLSNKFELDSYWMQHGRIYQKFAIKKHGRSTSESLLIASLTPYGAVNKVDAIVNEAFKIVNADDRRSINEEEFKKTMTEILGCIMLQLEGDLVFVSSNSVVNEPLVSSSSLLSPPLKDSDLSL